MHLLAKQPLGQSPEKIAKRLGRISYAEVEEFCLDVRRRYVLSILEKSLKTIVAEQLEIWVSRAQGSTSPEEEGSDGKTSAINPSHT